MRPPPFQCALTGGGCEGGASDISSRLLKVNIEKGTVPRVPHLVQHLTFPTHGRFLFPWPEGLEGSIIENSKGLPMIRPYALIGSRCFVRSYFTATWVRSLKLCKATNCKPRTQWVADDVWGGARGSGPGAEAHRHPKTFGAEPFNPVGAWKLGRHHPPTHPPRALWRP